MKSKITKRLILYFSSALLVYTVVIAIVFSVLFVDHTSDIYYNELTNKAESIAETLASFDTGGGLHGRGQGGGYGAYFRFINDIAMTDVWVVDNQSQLISVGNGNRQYNYSEMPEGALQVINDALAGNLSYNESFSDLLGERTMTVGAPIKHEDGSITGAVLLHSPVNSTKDAVFDGIKILSAGIITALFVVLILAVFLSRKFTLPLRKIDLAAQLIAGGDYTVQTAINQNDEIGTLAKTIDDMAKQLAHAKEESARYEQMRQNFIYSVSHELRTPVTVIRGSIEAINDGVIQDPAQKEEYLQQIQSESVHMQKLINDLLDLARLQNVDFKMEVEPVNLVEAVQDVLRGLKSIADNKDISLEFQKETDLAVFTGDYGRIRQVLVILIDNAIKFSDSEETVIVKLSQVNGHYIIDIQNKGETITESDRPFIFNQYHQANKKSKNGTGLGLAIAKEITDLLGIKIHVTSENCSTVFRLEFIG